MKYCDKCKVNLPSHQNICPLCQSELISKKGNNDVLCKAFKVIPTVYSQFSMFFKILIFGSICSIVISTTLNILLPYNIFWCLFVLVGVVYFWLAILTSINKHKNVAKLIIYQMFLAVIVTTLFDFWIGGFNGWSINYFLPVACVTSVLSILIVAIVTRQKLEEYAIYLIINCIVLIAPIVLMITGLVTVLWPSLIAVSTDIIIISGVFIFAKQDWSSEFNRRFHL